MLKTPEGKWILFAVDGGAQAEFWPIDAMGMLRAGSHTAEPPDGVEPVAPQAPPRHALPPQAASAQTFVAPEGDAAAQRPRKKAE